MKTLARWLVATTAWFGIVGPLSLGAAGTYPLGPDSQVQPGVPQGELIGYEFSGSRIFPGTIREVTLYVPRQYDPAKAACVYVNQDGVQFNAPTVFDNLIGKGEMPVTVGVFVRPGVVQAPEGATAADRVNRSFEYDGLGDAYVRFLLEELLPDVETRTTADGRAIRLSAAGNDRAIGGASSGAIAAFTAAWERPGAFTRVFSSIGTYTALRGGDGYLTLVRKYEPKPIRIFLQDGSSDLNNAFGDWWMANQTMERALVFAGYEVEHAWGTGGHNGEHAAAVFPDAMRFLWQGWPEPVRGASTKNAMIEAILIPGEDWELVGEGYRISEGPAINARGEVFFTDIPESKSYKLDADGKPAVFVDGTNRANGQAFGPDGRLYAAASGAKQIVAYDAAGEGVIVAEGFSANDLVVAHNGNIYATNPGANENHVWLVRPDGTKQIVDSGLRSPNGLTLSPDQRWLYVADYRSHWVYSYRIERDGTLAHKQRFCRLHVGDGDDEAFTDGLKFDREGRLYVTTRLGIQVCDTQGRVQAIIPTPNGKITNLAFVGEDLDTIFATCNERVYRRKVKVRGVNAWAPPFKPETPAR